MAGKSTLDPDNRPADGAGSAGQGHDTKSLGPGDSSDSGSDVAGSGDRQGTGERGTAGKEPAVRPNADLGPDRVVGAEEAGLGGGLDQAEQAQLGKLDEDMRWETVIGVRPRRPRE